MEQAVISFYHEYEFSIAFSKLPPKKIYDKDVMCGERIFGDKHSKRGRRDKE
jgi:hypothetical protein